MSLITLAPEYGVTLDFVHARHMGEAIEKLNEACFDAGVLDVVLPGVTGVSLAREIRKHDPLIPLAYLTNIDSDAFRAQAQSQRALFLYKQHFQRTENGMRRLLKIIDDLAHKNPCLEGGIRVDSHGFPRQLPNTPFEISEPFQDMLNHSKAMVRAA